MDHRVHTRAYAGQEIASFPGCIPSQEALHYYMMDVAVFITKHLEYAGIDDKQTSPVQAYHGPLVLDTLWRVSPSELLTSAHTT